MSITHTLVLNNFRDAYDPEEGDRWSIRTLCEVWDKRLAPPDPDRSNSSARPNCESCRVCGDWLDAKGVRLKSWWATFEKGRVFDLVERRTELIGLKRKATAAELPLLMLIDVREAFEKYGKP